MDLEQQFDIHAVGQGFFYSGNLKYRRLAEFNFVFDCGSENKEQAKREIDDYRSGKFAGHKRLNLLVLSHFDADHVNMVHELLSGGIIVDRLVMPFTLFEERLLLALRFVAGSGGFSDGDDRTLRLTLDPVAALGNNLDGDSEIYLVENDPEPIPPAVSDSNFSESDGFSNQEQLYFTFPGKQQLDNSEYKQLVTTADPRTYLVKDNRKSTINYGPYKLMDFLFYKKDLGPGNDAFFKEVAKLFFKRSGIDPEASDLVDRIVAYIALNYRSATRVKRLFNDAKKFSGLGRVTVDDLNITALCLLHRNVIRPKKDLLDYDAICRHVNHFSKHSRPVLSHPIYYHPGVEPYRYDLRPTVMLTSDSFLKESVDLNAFKAKYHDYLQECSLVQVPHHGSEKNITADFFRTFNWDSEFFINYGLTNRHKHPSASIFVLPFTLYHLSPFLVNEYQGLRYDIFSNI